MNPAPPGLADTGPVPAWRVGKSRSIYQSPWVSLDLVEVQPEGEDAFEHHVVRMGPAAAVIVHREGSVLLIWRHRFITGTWGWELPAGRLDPGENPEQAGAREVLEETGWRPSPPRMLFSFHPVPGISDHLFHILVSDGAEYVGAPVDTHEADRIEWVAAGRLPELIRTGQVPDGYTLAGLLWWLGVER